MEDTAIVELYWTRDQRAIVESDRKYGGYCGTMARNILKNIQDAEECVNDTWHRAWLSMPPQRPATLRAYFLKIVRNLCVDRWRGKQAQKRGAGLEVLSMELEDCLPAGKSAEQEVEDREVTACIQKWLDGLSREERAIFVRRYWYGERVDELAKQWNCAANAMAQRLRRLRLDLKNVLEREGVML